MTFWEHVGELRQRIVWSLASVLVAAIGSFVYWRQLYRLLLWPLKHADPDATLHYLAPQETFLVSMRIAIAAGVIFASPFVLWQGWAFIGPGLTRRERNYVRPVLPIVAMLFLCGVAFVYYILLPTSLGFLLGYAEGVAEGTLTQGRYFSFVTALLVAGGVLFQLPAVMAILGWLGITGAGWLWQKTGWALVVLMTLAAIITPTGDAVNMLILTAPLMALYLLGVALVWLIQRTGRRRAAE
jgi:sec-independent protein translocase protein TatC